MYMALSKKVLNTYALQHALIRHREHAHNKLTRNHPHAVDFFAKLGLSPGQIRQQGAKLFASSMLAGSLVLGSPALIDFPKSNFDRLEELPITEREKNFSDELKTHLIYNSLSLTLPQEIMISKLIHDYWGINATPVLEGNKLNHSYAYMGYEQHLKRYPGDTISQHDEYVEAGIAPARGAFGYFTDSKKKMDDGLAQKEKYYVAVQTLYLPNWNKDWASLKEWYKFRKVVVVNPENGKTVIADIADAGPARWTGKQFGGSPEIMEHLGLVTGKKKGKVILFFVNDPDDKIALGPVGYTRSDDLAMK